MPNHLDTSDSPPIVLAASGLDPTGSAGLLADIRVISSVGCHPCGVVTCETVQSSAGLTQISPADPKVLNSQLRALFHDLPIKTVKIGAMASVETIEALAKVLDDYPDPLVVLDPVFAPTTGPAFLDPDGMRAMSSLLLPRVFLATPNLKELGAPAGIDVDPGDDEMIRGCVDGWLGTGVRGVLVTGIRTGNIILDRLFLPELPPSDFAHGHCDVGEVHGTGCVLSSAIATFLAKALDIIDAIDQASVFTLSAIQNARIFGSGSAFWVDNDICR